MRRRKRHHLDWKFKRIIIWVAGLALIAALVWFILTPVTCTVNGRTILYEPDYSSVVKRKFVMPDSIKAAIQQFKNRGKLVSQSKTLKLSVTDNPTYFSRRDVWAGTVTIKNTDTKPLTFNPFQEPRLVVLDNRLLVIREEVVKRADARAARIGVTLNPGESYAVRRYVMFKQTPEGEYFLFSSNERFKIRQPGTYEFLFVMNDAASGRRSVQFDPYRTLGPVDEGRLIGQETEAPDEEAPSAEQPAGSSEKPPAH